jgi:hypothetical protein
MLQRPRPTQQPTHRIASHQPQWDRTRFLQMAAIARCTATNIATALFPIVVRLLDDHFFDPLMRLRLTPVRLAF